MGSRNPSAADGLVFGSVAKSVVRHTGVPVTATGPGIDAGVV
jgi:nucleotide-binding universal stress UspA family protein